jgi:hypothetical protein
MGFFFRKSKSIGPAKINLSSGGLGFSLGMKHMRVGIGPKGPYISAGLGHGIRFIKYLGKFLGK